MQDTGKVVFGVSEVVDYIIRGYDYSVTEKQPAKTVVCDIIDKMRFILFPEYFRNEYNRGKTLEYGLGYVLEDISYNLKSQVLYAISFLPEYKQYHRKSLQELSQKITRGFISKIPKIREYLLTDVEAAFEGDPAAYSKAEIIISYPGIFACMVNRIAHEIYLLGVPLIPRMMTEYAHSVTGIDIHPGAAIGKYFFMDHGTGIVIGETAVIGNHVKIYQGVTLGALSTRGGQKLRGVKRHPTIEDYVTIYSGASILGGETVIGENTVIGSNAFVTKSVPDRTKVSIKNPELQFRNSGKIENVRIELEQDEFWHYVI